MNKLRTSFLSLLIIAFFLVCYWLKEQNKKSDGNVSDDAKIVTLAPSTGEVVCALNLGHQLVGVSRFATFPPEVLDKPKVGGYLDLDLEAVIRLDPDVVVLLKEQKTLSEKLQQLGLEVLLVDHMSVQGILNSISIIGERFGKNREAEALNRSIKEKIQQVQMHSSNGKDRKVLLTIGRKLGQGKVTEIVAAGTAGYHQQLLQIAGYKNAYTGSENFPQLSRENLIRTNPDIIIELISSADAKIYGEEKIVADWLSCPELNAVKTNNIFLLVGDVHFVPGPRIVQTLECIYQKRERLKKNAE